MNTQQAIDNSCITVSARGPKCQYFGRAVVADDGEIIMHSTGPEKDKVGNLLRDYYRIAPKTVSNIKVTLEDNGARIILWLTLRDDLGIEFCDESVTVDIVTAEDTIPNLTYDDFVRDADGIGESPYIVKRDEIEILVTPTGDGGAYVTPNPKGVIAGFDIKSYNGFDEDCSNVSVHVDKDEVWNMHRLLWYLMV